MGEDRENFGEPLTLDESYDRLAGNFDNLRDELKKQDNRATAHPMYVVQQLMKAVYDEDGDSINYWFDVQPFFTEKAANQYIRNNARDFFGETRVYVKSGQRNSEWCLIREFLHGNKNDT